MLVLSKELITQEAQLLLRMLRVTANKRDTPSIQSP